MSSKENGRLNIVSFMVRNGLLIEHNLVEVNGQNVVGLKVRSQKDI